MCTKLRCSYVAVGWVFEVQCSWHLQPFWSLLLPVTTLHTASFQPTSRAFFYHTSLKHELNGPQLPILSLQERLSRRVRELGIPQEGRPLSMTCWMQDLTPAVWLLLPKSLGQGCKLFLCHPLACAWMTKQCVLPLVSDSALPSADPTIVNFAGLT